MKSRPPRCPGYRVQAVTIIVVVVSLWLFWPTGEKRRHLQPPLQIANLLKSCSEVRPPDGIYKEIVVNVPGVHCVVTDFWQRHLSDFAGHSAPTSNRYLIGVRANDVVIDLAGYTLRSDGDSEGIRALRLREGLRPIAKSLTIRNGVLDIRGLGTGIKYVDRRSMHGLFAEFPDVVGFHKSRVVLENLYIRTDNIGVELEGDGNIIRNCIIESGGNGSIMMAGPNGKIQDNTIIFNQPVVPASLVRIPAVEQLQKLSEAREVDRAAIALFQANGTVVSNNRIQVKGHSRRRHGIYVTGESLGVIVEENSISGTKYPVTLTKGSTAVMLKNSFENR